MAFGQSIQKIGLNSTSIKRGPIGNADDPLNTIESIRRDPYGVNGTPDHKEDRCIFWVQSSSAWAGVKSASRIRSARIQLHATSTLSDTNNTVDFHSSGTGSNNVTANIATWSESKFRTDWPVAGGNITTVHNRTSIPGAGAWSGNAAEATKSMKDSDYPLWVGKMNVELEAASSAGNDTMNFYDENAAVTSKRPYLIVVLGKEKMPRRLQAHRRRLT